MRDGLPLFQRGSAMTALQRQQHPRIVAALSDALNGCPPEVLDLFDVIFFHHPPMRTAELAESTGIDDGALLSRFYRAGLPSPALLLRHAPVVRVAYMLENPYWSGAQVARMLGFANPQSLHRIIRDVTGVTLLTFRLNSDGDQQMSRYVSRFITPYIDAWKTKPVLSPRRFDGRAA